MASTMPSVRVKSIEYCTRRRWQFRGVRGCRRRNRCGASGFHRSREEGLERDHPRVRGADDINTDEQDQTSVCPARAGMVP